MGFDRMIALLNSEKVEDWATSNCVPRMWRPLRAQVLECSACILRQACAARTSINRGLERGQAPGEVLHMDTYLVTCAGSDGIVRKQYGLAIMDAHSREGWHARLCSQGRSRCESDQHHPRDSATEWAAR